MRAIYLHGFQSSSQSHKGQALKLFCEANQLPVQIELPSLPDRPTEAKRFIENQLAGDSVLAVVGSSLGGCYAHWVASYFHIKAVLVNPAVHAHRLMRPYIGDNLNPSTHAPFKLDQQDIDCLETLDSYSITQPENFFCMLQKGDETLDWSLAADRYANCKLHIEEGGSHAFDNWQQQLPQVLEYILN
ncbi:MAG: YqiA/YcfP family alpha/beta fold hydrolase [Gammaproteobacteria bacterium]